MRKAIAIDFDGCLCDWAWPDIGKPHMDVVNAAIREQQNGAALILWTCRVGRYLDEAIKFCSDLGLTFDAVNANLPERIDAYQNDCRKVNADEYWDDRSVRMPMNLLPPLDPIETAIADWHCELTRIAIKLGRAELLAQLAEEAAELSQAALKLRRVLDGRNPTPVTEAEATLHLQEELTDVLLCAITVGVDRTEVERFIRAKSARWSARVEGDDDDV